MQYAIVKGGVPHIISGAFVDSDGVQHSSSILSLWSNEELAEIGVYPITKQDAPAGKTISGYTLLFSDGKVEVKYDLEDIDIQQLRAEAASSIDRQAEDERQKYITPGTGQAMTYQSKATEAIRYHETNGQGDYPFLSEEVGITGDTLADVAATILTMHHEWQIIGGQIERERLAAKKAVELATTVTELNNIKPVWP